MESLVELIKNKIGSDASKVFKKLMPLSYKADLGKYCIGYLYGGCYADITIKFSQGIKLDKIEFLGFSDCGDGVFKPWTLPYPMKSSLIYAEAKAKY